MDASGLGGGANRSSASSSSSSTASSQHAALLGTVLELRGDLEKAMNKMAKMDEQNAALAANYQLLKDELLDTRRKYNEARGNYLQAAEEKIESERNHESFISKMEIELKEKKAQFDALFEKKAPKDIDFIRIQVQEELEIPHRQKLQAMGKEMQKYQDAYYEMRRELEKCKAEYEAYSQNQQKEVNSIRDEHQGLVLILRDQIAKLQEDNHVVEKDEQLRQKTMKIHELQRMLDEMREDNRSLAQERETLSLSLSQVRVKTDEAVERLRDKALVADAARQGSEERLSHAVSECDRKDVLFRQARQAQEELSTHLDTSKRNLVASEQAVLALRTDHKRELEDLTLAFQAERRGLHEQLEAASGKLHAALEGQRRAQRETSEIQLRCESLESDMRRSHLATMQQLQKRNGALELQLAELEQKLRAIDEDRAAANSANSADIDVLRSEVSRYKREKEALHDKVRELEHTVEGERRKVTSLKREQAARKEYVDLDMKEERAKMASLEAEVMLGKIREAELASLKSELERKLAEQQELTEGLGAEAKGRLTSISAMYKDKVTQMKSRLKSALVMEQKRAEAYKNKALEAHARGKELMALHAHAETD